MKRYFVLYQIIYFGFYIWTILNRKPDNLFETVLIGTMAAISLISICICVNKDYFKSVPYTVNYALLSLLSVDILEKIVIDFFSKTNYDVSYRGIIGNGFRIMLLWYIVIHNTTRKSKYPR